MHLVSSRQCAGPLSVDECTPVFCMQPAQYDPEREGSVNLFHRAFDVILLVS